MPIAKPTSWVIGSHIFVALEGATLSDASNVIKPAGDVSSPTTVGVDAKPSINDSSWVKLGHVAECSFNTDGGTKIDIWEPATGRIVLAEIIRTARATEMKVKARQVQPLTIQLALNTQLLNAGSTQFNPHAGPTVWKGWVKLQAYTHLNASALTLEFWSEAMLSSELKLDPKASSDPEYSFSLLNSRLNTGAI